MARLRANTRVVHGNADPITADVSETESYLETAAPITTLDGWKQFDVLWSLIHRVVRWKIEFEITQHTRWDYSAGAGGLEEWTSHVKGWGYSDAALSQIQPDGTFVFSTVDHRMLEKLMTASGSGLSGRFLPGITFENESGNNSIEINDWSGSRTGGADPGAFIGGAAAPFAITGAHVYGAAFAYRGPQRPYPILGNQLGRLDWLCNLLAIRNAFNPSGRYPTEGLSMFFKCANEQPAGLSFIGNATVKIPDWISGTGFVDITQKLWASTGPPGGATSSAAREMGATLTISPLKCLPYGTNDYGQHGGEVTEGLWNDDGTSVSWPYVGTQAAT